jgi:hypothetical protein
MAQHPGASRAGVRFNLVLVDVAGHMRRIADALRVAE